MDVSIENSGLQTVQATAYVPRESKADPVSKTGGEELVLSQQEIKLQNPTDRVEISDEGREALARSMTASPESVQARPEAQQAQAPSQTAQTVQSMETVEADAKTAERSGTEEILESVSDSTASTNLTTLTEQQISDLVSKGTITQAEANTELARREAARQAQTAASQSGQPENAVEQVQETME